MVTFVKTRSGLQVYSPVGEAFIVGEAHPLFKQIKNLVMSDSAAFEDFKAMWDTQEEASLLKDYIIVNDDLNIERTEGEVKVTYKGLELPPSLTRRFVRVFTSAIEEEGHVFEEMFGNNNPVGSFTTSLEPVLNFVENLLKNPARSSVNELYNFLEVCSLPITSDGCFLAYKKVRYNYHDIHSGEFNNSVGEVLKMQRWEVDDNREKTCSTGFHCCSYEYLSHFGSTSKDSHRIVIVKVNPKDVVSVPADYANQKMRVSEYTVVDEIPGACHSKLSPWYTPARLEGRVGELMDRILNVMESIGTDARIDQLADIKENGINFNEVLPMPLSARKSVFHLILVSLEEMSLNLEHLDFQEFEDEDYDITIENLVNFITERVS